MTKSPIVFGCLFFVAALGFAQNNQDVGQENKQEGNRVHYPTQEGIGQASHAARKTNNLVYHTGGTVIRNAHLVMIFWGPSFGTNGADRPYATTLQNYRNQFGTTGEYNTITQYYGEDSSSGYGNILPANLAGGTPDWFDPSTPLTSVTDAAVQGEVLRYLASNAFDNNNIYEVFIPSSSYSSDGGGTSCGGPALQYCAYHGWFSNGGRTIKYSIEPYPSCSGCSISGWSAAQNQEHFVCHETRETVTDAKLNAWYDRVGYEADDKCAWSPTPFIGTGGYAYQYEWSNANSGCVKIR
jgi:hypothetical protein